MPSHTPEERQKVKKRERMARQRRGTTKASPSKRTAGRIPKVTFKTSSGSSIT